MGAENQAALVGLGGLPLGYVSAWAPASFPQKPQAGRQEHGRLAGSRGADGATWWLCAGLNLYHHEDLAVLTDPVPPEVSRPLCVRDQSPQVSRSLSGQLPGIPCSSGGTTFPKLAQESCRVSRT